MGAKKPTLGVMLGVILLAGCGGGGGTGATVGTSTARGALVQNPPLRVASLTASDLAAQIGASASGQQLLALSGSPLCGVDYHYLQYWTVGAAGEAIQDSGVLMVPTAPPGASASILAQCTGPRPMVLYGHGTNPMKSYNLAAVNDQTNPANAETGILSAFFAGQGNIVIAPNYAGYDTSTLPYHPYLNADQQSKDMIDAMTAGRAALGHVFASNTVDNGKLFITGYSEGGYVAMATHRAMQAAGMTVTASAPMSGPYALEAFADALFFGDVDLGATLFSPLLTTGYQQAYGNVYQALADVYNPTYATGIDRLLPSSMPLSALFQQNKLPQTAEFSLVPPSLAGNAPLNALFATLTPPTTPASLAPLFALGFSATNFLVNNSFRAAYLADAMVHPDGAVPSATTGLPATAPALGFRTDLKTNDLRNWVPRAPVLLCGGHSDPTVFYNVNTQVMQAFWAHQWVAPAPLQVVDVDGGTAPVGPLQTGFSQAEAAMVSVAGGGAAGQSAVLQAYHGTLVPPFCTAAVRSFFNQF